MPAITNLRQGCGLWMTRERCVLGKATRNNHVPNHVRRSVLRQSATASEHIVTVSNGTALRSDPPVTPRKRVETTMSL